jgi:hypothetical protein
VLHRFSSWWPPQPPAEVETGREMGVEEGEDCGIFASGRETARAGDMPTAFELWSASAQDDSLPPEIVEAYQPERDEDRTTAVPLLSLPALALLVLALLVIALFLQRVL